MAGHRREMATVIRDARQDAVLLLEILDDLELAAVHPAREHEQQELERRDRHLRRSYRAEIPVRPAPRRSGERQSIDASRWFHPILCWHRTGSGTERGLLWKTPPLGPSHPQFPDWTGVLSTPVIDPDRNTMFVVYKTWDDGRPAHWLAALDIRNNGNVLNKTQISARTTCSRTRTSISEPAAR